MADIHCHRCGGFIANPEGTTYREASVTTPPVAPHSGLCMCDYSLVYGPVPEPAGRGLRGVYRLRSASRN
ncbi:MAG TPA: hypothetical protein VK124_05890 [Gemmatimonadales bacterium]|nr:hypothetical protein [Gemmatimonadales bacterium]